MLLTLTSGMAQVDEPTPILPDIVAFAQAAASAAARAAAQAQASADAAAALLTEVEDPCAICVEPYGAIAEA